MNLLGISALFFFLVLFENTATSVGRQLVSNECAKCLCNALSGCKNEAKCVLVETYSACGLFKMTKPYWTDGGTLTVKGDKPGDKKAFEHCARSYTCARSSLENYMIRYKKDCNGDGKIDCKDFAAIHLRGAGACDDSKGKEFGETVGKCVKDLKRKKKKST